MSTVIISPIVVVDTSSTNPQIVEPPPPTVGVSHTVSVV
jgi:hypothetical protein